MRGESDERGSTIPLIIGFALVLLLVVGVVIDATAAYLRRQELANLADGAALRGADLGAAGTEVYGSGLGAAADLQLTPAVARQAVDAYLAAVDAYGRYPGLLAEVSVDTATRRVLVHLRAPADLPLHVPGSPAHPIVGAQGSAVVALDR